LVLSTDFFSLLSIRSLSLAAALAAFSSRSLALRSAFCFLIEALLLATPAACVAMSDRSPSLLRELLRGRFFHNYLFSQT